LGSATDAVAPLRSLVASVEHAIGARSKALGFFSAAGFLIIPHGDKGKASGHNNSGASAFNKFLISKLAVMPIHLFPHFLELVG